MIYLCWLFFKQRSIIKPNLIFSFKVMKLKLLIVALFCSVLGWGQTTIFQYDLEGGTTPSVDNGVDTPAYSVIGTLTSATGTCNGAGSVTHSAWNTNDGYRFTVNTTGYNTLNFSYVERASNTAISTSTPCAFHLAITWKAVLNKLTFKPPHNPRSVEIMM